MFCNVNAGRSIGGTRRARHKDDAGAACEARTRICHHGRATFLTTDGDFDLCIVKSIKRCEIGFTRHTEHMTRALNDELVNEDLTACACIIHSRASPIRIFQDFFFMLTKRRRGSFTRNRLAIHHYG